MKATILLFLILDLLTLHDGNSSGETTRRESHPASGESHHLHHLHHHHAPQKSHEHHSFARRSEANCSSHRHPSPYIGAALRLSDATVPPLPVERRSEQRDGYFFDDLCAPLTAAAVAAAVERSSGSKKRFFEALRSAAPTNLTRRPYDNPGIALTPTTAAAAALFMGDSITGELAGVFEGLTNMRAARVVRIVGVSSSGRGGVCAIRTGIHAALHEKGSEGPFSAIFVGGYSLHHLFRGGRWLRDYSDKPHPTEAHRSLMAAVLRSLAAVSNGPSLGGLPLVFIGSYSAEGAVLHLSPPKHDWVEFYDHSLPAIWDGIEAEIFQQIQLHGGRGGRNAFPNFFHFRPLKVAQACPGVRCDGMHYGSWGEDTECKNSKGVWYRPLADFLLRSFPAG